MSTSIEDLALEKIPMSQVEQQRQISHSRKRLSFVEKRVSEHDLEISTQGVKINYIERQLLQMEQDLLQRVNEIKNDASNLFKKANELIETLHESRGVDKYKEKIISRLVLTGKILLGIVAVLGSEWIWHKLGLR